MTKEIDYELPFHAWIRLIVAYNNIEPCYAHFVSRRTGVTYSHITSVNNKLEQNGIIGYEKMGRVKVIKLTAKGQLLADFFQTRFPELLRWGGVSVIYEQD